MDADVTVSAARPTVPARRGLRLRDAAPRLTGAGIWPASRHPVTRDPALARPGRRARPGNRGWLVSGGKLTDIGFRDPLPRRAHTPARPRARIQPPTGCAGPPEARGGRGQEPAPAQKARSSGVERRGGA